MANSFDSAAMAAGYAKSCPNINPLIIERARKHLSMPLPVEHGLDVGCGAGLSTKALPHQWLTQLSMRAEITKLADQLRAARVVRQRK